MKKIQCSVSEYGALRRRPNGKPMTRQAIIEYLQRKKDLIGVVSSKKIGNFWVLEVDSDFYNKNKHNLK